MKNSFVKKSPNLRFPEFSEEWKEKKLRQILSLVVDNRGKTPPTEKTGIALIEVNAFSEKHIDYSAINKYVSQDVYDKWFRKYLNDADILFCTVGATAKVALYSDHTKAVIAQNIVGLRFKVEDQNFMYYLLSFGKNNHKFKRIEMGAVQPSVKVSQMVEIDFDLPSLQEQQKIASFLSSVDTWIQNLEKQKASLEAYKKGMMQKIFSQEMRFRDDDGSEYPEWENKKVEEIFRITRGNVLSKNKIKSNYTSDFKYPVYSSQTQDNGLMGYYTDYLYEDAITWTTDGANAGEVNFRKGKFYCTNVCGVLLSKEGYANEVLAEILNLISRKYVSYVGNPKLMNNVMATISVTIPSLKEQKKISSLLVSIDKLINIKAKQIHKAKNWKKGLLQQMLV